MTDIAILVPSRGRPGNVVRLAAAVAATAVLDYRIFVRLDDDDFAVDAYPPLAKVTYVHGPRVRYGASTNELAALAAAERIPFLALLGDDVLPQSEQWDAQLCSALHTELGVAYGSDGLEHLHGVELPTHVVVPTEVYRRLGWVILPELRHLFADNAWRELGRGLGNFQYVPTAKLTHLHPWNRAAPSDDTYAEANDAAHREKDRLAFEAWRDGPGLPAALAKLKGLPA